MKTLPSQGHGLGRAPAPCIRSIWHAYMYMFLCVYMYMYIYVHIQNIYIYIYIIYIYIILTSNLPYDGTGAVREHGMREAIAASGL